MPTVSWQTQESGDILIEYPLVVKPLLKAIFARFNRDSNERLTRRLQLDSLGSQVWLLIDGSNNVGEIIRAFAKESTRITSYNVCYTKLLRGQFVSLPLVREASFEVG